MIVGLTGGIGSGKTTVAKFFGDLGIPLYFSDNQAKVLINENKKIKKQLIRLFGEETYKNGIYNSKYVASIVFWDKEKLKQLAKIVHPELREDFMQWYKKQKSPYVIKEAAILFESGAYKDCNFIITVVAPIKIRIERIMKRDGIDELSVRKRIANQWTDEQRLKLSDYVIKNTTIDNLKQEVNKIHSILIKKLLIQ